MGKSFRAISDRKYFGGRRGESSLLGRGRSR
jgi:hypothetical protein